MTTSPNWLEIRKGYNILDRYTYLNTPACGLMHPVVHRAAVEEGEQLLLGASQHNGAWMFEKKPLVVDTVARFINAPEGSVALSPNFSIPMNMVAEMLLPEIRNVAVLQGDYPSITLPFKLRDFQTHEFALQEDATIDYDQLETFMERQNIQLLALGHVQWSTGYVVDLQRLAQICKRSGILFLVDGTQSAGVIPMDIQAIDPDIYLTSTYKWLGSGFGNGFLYLRENILQQFAPKVAGFNSMLWKNGTPYYEVNIKNFEPGHLDHQAFIRLKTAIEWQTQIGLDEIWQRVQGLVGYFQSKCQVLGIEPLYSFEGEAMGSIQFLKGDAQVVKSLSDHGILTVPRGEGVRLGLHFYNTEEDIDQLLEVYTQVAHISA